MNHMAIPRLALGLKILFVIVGVTGKKQGSLCFKKIFTRAFPGLLKILFIF